MSGKNAVETIRNWIAIVAIILSLGVTFGYTKANVDNIKLDLIEMRDDMVTNEVLDEIVKRFDQSAARIEKSVDRMEGKLDNKLEKND